MLNKKKDEEKGTNYCELLGIDSIPDKQAQDNTFTALSDLILDYLSFALNTSDKDEVNLALGNIKAISDLIGVSLTKDEIITVYFNRL